MQCSHLCLLCHGSMLPGSCCIAWQAPARTARQSDLPPLEAGLPCVAPPLPLLRLAWVRHPLACLRARGLAGACLQAVLTTSPTSDATTFRVDSCQAQASASAYDCLLVCLLSLSPLSPPLDVLLCCSRRCRRRTTFRVPCFHVNCGHTAQTHGAQEQGRPCHGALMAFQTSPAPFMLPMLRTLFHCAIAHALASTLLCSACGVTSGPGRSARGAWAGGRSWLLCDSLRCAALCCDVSCCAVLCCAVLPGPSCTPCTWAWPRTSGSP